MSRRRRWSWLFAGMLGCAVPADDAGQAPVESSQAIIYGQDDRQEVYEHPDPVLRAIAQSSAVALIPRSRFGRNARGDFAIFTPRLSEAFQVCPDQRFAAEPTAADCSGVLIDDDLVLTAGHCLASDDACDRFAFVFDYFYKDDGGLAGLSWGDIYGCRRVVDRSVSSGDAGNARIDYAIVQLDRVPLGRTPVRVRASGLSLGEPLATIGCASGLPTKIDSGAHVLNVRAATLDFFLLDSDTFAGSSGSGVFDAMGQLVGVLVRGGQDYEVVPDAGCMVPKVISADQVLSTPDAGGDVPADPAPSDARGGDATAIDAPEEDTAPGDDLDAGATGEPATPRQAVRVPSGGSEEATYVARAIEGLCARGWPSARLCGAVPSCGDGFCTASETRMSCPADCGCSGSDCEASAKDLAALAGSPVPKSRQASEGCSAVPERPPAGAFSWLIVGFGATAWIARARARSRRGLSRRAV